jgi:hypothetical protein
LHELTTGVVACDRCIEAVLAALEEESKEDD